MEFIIQKNYLADGSDFIQTIECAASRSAEGGGDEERVKSVLDVLHHGLLQPVPPEDTLVVRLQDPELDKSNHGGFLHTRMSFLWMKTNLVFITFLALLIVIKCTGTEVIQISTLLLEYYSTRPHSSHNTITVISFIFIVKIRLHIVIMIYVLI